jgi:hypothetical protein
MHSVGYGTLGLSLRGFPDPGPKAQAKVRSAEPTDDTK